MKNRRYPDSLEDLVTPDDRGASYGDTTESPIDPWGNAFVYELTRKSEEPSIMGYGADGKPGGAGNDADITYEDITKRS